MNKKYLVKILIIMYVVLIVSIAVLGLLIASVSDRHVVKVIGISVFIGVLIGGSLGVYLIPKKFADKDERTIVITLVSRLMANLIFGMTSYLCMFFILTGVLVVETMSPIVIISITGIILISTILTEKISYFIIEKKL